MDDDEATIMHDADRCADLWAAVIEQARSHARGIGLHTITSGRLGRSAAQKEAQEFLEEIGAVP